ncbi:MAG: hypothetical protein ABIM89_10930 [Mycobacteriales bacterium]
MRTSALRAPERHRALEAVEDRADPPVGRVAVNLRYARARYDEGGAQLVLKRALGKGRRLAHTALGTTAGRVRQWLAMRGAGALESTGAFELLREQFAPEWYVAFYGLPTAGGQSDPFEHYISIGARHGFSPCPDFDEVAYRSAHPAVAAAVSRGAMLCGRLHYQLYGRAAHHQVFAIADAAPGSTEFPLHGPMADAVREDFQPDWYVETYPDVARVLARGGMPSPLWHYLTEGARSSLSPNPWFDERWYLRTYSDVGNAKVLGSLPNGFFHYLSYGRAEGRRTNSAAPRSPEEGYTALTRPVAIDRLALMERRFQPYPYRVTAATGTRRVNFLVPSLDKNLVFGGYIAALNFLKRLLDRGWEVRLLILDDATCTAERLRKQFAHDSLGGSVVARAEIVNLATRSQVLDISTEDSFVAYSMWSAYHADILASAVGRQFMFFIQEFEPTFHHHDSWHAIGASMYHKPHFALFNSELLQQHFMTERLGVFGPGEEHGRRRSAVFAHALAVPRPPMPGELVRGGIRQLLFYARPEAHAARNLFEVGVAALRRAVSDGVFDGDDWSFEGVGSLATETSLKLGSGRELSITPRLTLGDYAGALRRYEVGLSMQYSPHPGVVHYEMAASGMIVVTNTFSNRSRADLLARAPNLVPVEPSIDGVSSGLAEAVVRARDVDACLRGARGPAVTSWDESFNDELMSTIEAELS